MVADLGATRSVARSGGGVGGVGGVTVVGGLGRAVVAGRLVVGRGRSLDVGQVGRVGAGVVITSTRRGEQEHGQDEREEPHGA